MNRVRRFIVTAVASAAALATVVAASATTAIAAVAPSSTLGPPSAVVTADGSIQVFAVGGGQIWQNWQNPRTFTHGNWVGQPTPIIFVGTLSLVPRSDNRIIDIFARTSTNAIVETWYDSRTGAWGGWDTLGAAGGAGDPRAVATADGNVQVFLTSRGQAEENWFDPRTGNHGQFASPRFTPLSPVVGRPAVVARPGNTIVDVFARAANANVLETWYSSVNGAWGNWINLGGFTHFDPSAVAAPPTPDEPKGTPFRDLVVENTDVATASNSFVTVTGDHGEFSSFDNSVPAPLTGPVALVSLPGAAEGIVDGFVLGTDGRVFQFDVQFSGGGQGWGSLGAVTSNPPEAVYGPDGNDHVVTTSGAGAAIDWFAHYTGAMSGWRPLQ